MYNFDSSILWQRPIGRMIVATFALCMALASLGSWWSRAESPMPFSSLVQFQYDSARDQGTHENRQSHHAYLPAPLGQSPMANPALVYSSYIGGDGADHGKDIALDTAGNIYLAGTTSERDDFPITDNAHQLQCGDILYDPDTYCFEDGVVMVLNPQGEVIYASYHGGSFTDDPQAIAADGKGNIVIAGDTGSGQFPLVNAIQESCPLDTSTGDCSSSRGYVSVIHLDEEEATLSYSTYLGSTERNSNNAILAAAMDKAGNAYVTGYTSGKKFPLANAIQDELYESFCYTFSSERYCFDGFVTKFSPKGELLMSTYLGADFDEYPYGLTLDTKGNIYLTGTTEGSEFPTTENAYESSNLVNDDAFLVKIAMPATTAPRPRPAPLGALQLGKLITWLTSQAVHESSYQPIHNAKIDNS